MQLIRNLLNAMVLAFGRGVRKHPLAFVVLCVATSTFAAFPFCEVKIEGAPAAFVLFARLCLAAWVGVPLFLGLFGAIGLLSGGVTIEYILDKEDPAAAQARKS